MKPRIYLCPVCRKKVRAKTSHFPFCSERCRLLDLGQWLDGKFRVAGEPVTLTETEDLEGGRER